MKDPMIEVRAEKVFFTNSVDLVVVQQGADGNISVGRSLTMERLEPGMPFGEPTLRLKMDAAQLLIDELWRCGLRPSEGSGSAGSLAATERHLRDMQKIALGLLKEHGV